MKKLSRIRLSSVSEKLSDSEMKSVIGGYGYYCNNTDCDGSCSRAGDDCCIKIEDKKHNGTCMYGNIGSPLHCVL
ncbi:MAG: TIGR04149 family rSAM-modified RiPP [Tannerella sp.]|nr:TIGR04149 family rSAM-modified RiPP [Tannerella sp.]